MSGKKYPFQTNREQTRVPRGKSYWCGNCDRDRVWSGQKCKTCKIRSSDQKTRLKPLGRYIGVNYE